MVLGTSSGAGKSLMTAALCRVLRREVDGQGLTERVRLTPMGRNTIAPWSDAIPPGGVLMRLKHWLRQHRPRI